MRFIHTADWQVGMKASHVGTAAARVREARLSSAVRVGDIARERHADFILIAGDMFDDNGVDRILIQKIADILAGYHLPVYIIPGNHDPFVPGSVWEHPAWRTSDSIHVLKEKTAVDMPGGKLFPCPALEKQSTGDPTLWIPCEDGNIRIGLAHGTVEGVRQDEPDYPIPRNAAELRGLDYLALGHWHSYASYPGEDGIVRMTYSGTHEQTKFGERDSGNVLFVEISARRSPPVITPVHIGSLRWIQKSEDIQSPGDVKKVLDEIEQLNGADTSLLSLTLRGLLFTQDHEKVTRIQEIISSRFLYADLDTLKLIPAPGDSGWIDIIPQGPVHDMAVRLKELADPAYMGTRPEGATVEIASCALLDLYGIIMESKR